MQRKIAYVGTISKGCFAAPDFLEGKQEWESSL